MVYGLHAVPGGNRTGPFRGFDELPDDGGRFNWNGARKRIVAR